MFIGNWNVCFVYQSSYYVLNSIDFPQEFQNRQKVDPVTLFTAPTIKKEAKPEV